MAAVSSHAIQSRGVGKRSPHAHHGVVPAGLDTRVILCHRRNDATPAMVAGHLAAAGHQGLCTC